MEGIIGFAVGWICGAGLLWLYFAASGMLRDEGEWKSYKERTRRK